MAPHFPDRGTLYHRVLELLPLEKDPGWDLVKAGLDGLVRQGRLKAEEAAPLIAAIIYSYT